jgi:hypothetical protein
VFVAALHADLRLPGATSLKDKRAVLRPLLAATCNRHGASAAEVGLFDLRQRAELGFSIVDAHAGHCGERLDALERFLWSRPEIEVVSLTRSWLESE